MLKYVPSLLSMAAEYHQIRSANSDK